MKINNNELSEIYGGLSLSATLFSSVSSLLGRVFSIGQSVGSSIRRISAHKMCPIK